MHTTIKGKQIKASQYAEAFDRVIEMERMTIEKYSMILFESACDMAEAINCPELTKNERFWEWFKHHWSVTDLFFLIDNPNSLNYLDYKYAKLVNNEHKRLDLFYFLNLNQKRKEYVAKSK